MQLQLYIKNLGGQDESCSKFFDAKKISSNGRRNKKISSNQCAKKTRQMVVTKKSRQIDLFVDFLNT